MCKKDKGDIPPGLFCAPAPSTGEIEGGSTGAWVGEEDGEFRGEVWKREEHFFMAPQKKKKVLDYLSSSFW